MTGALSEWIPKMKRGDIDEVIEKNLNLPPGAFSRKRAPKPLTLNMLNVGV